MPPAAPGCSICSRPTPSRDPNAHYLHPRYLRQIVRPVERVWADPGARWCHAADGDVAGEARQPAAVTVGQSRQLLLDGPHLGGRDLAGDVMRIAVTERIADHPTRADQRAADDRLYQQVHDAVAG